MIIKTSHIVRAGGLLLVLLVLNAWALPGSSTKFSNIGSIVNTRHNLTQRPIGSGAVLMNNARNDYGEVCVYCHTPHTNNITPRMPLWNRTIKATTYSTYDQLGTSTLNEVVSQPGSNSLTCLSCHDGQTAIDSIMNMPGSGMALNSQSTSQNNTFLDAWPGGPGFSAYGGHGTLEVSATAFDNYGECMSCHSVTGPQHDPGAMPEFDTYYIGTDLRNDHPVGITYPTTNGSGTDWNTPAGSKGTSLYFEVNGDGYMDKNEIRTYNGQVECASCHDPHGVPSAGTGSVFKPTFLRVDNAAGSAVCLTCHNK